MKTTLKSILTTLFVTVGFSACEAKTTLTTVPSVDLSRYAGTWYEVASYPQFFEKGCSNVKATYTSRRGYIGVFNQSVKNKKLNTIKGKAFIVDNSGNAKLKVQFFWPFRGDYWIIGLAGGYSWAIVSDPKRKTLWILSRTPKMNVDLYDSLIAKVVDKGFDKGKIVKMVQN